MRRRSLEIINTILRKTRHNKNYLLPSDNLCKCRSNPITLISPPKEDRHTDCSRLARSLVTRVCCSSHRLKCGHSNRSSSLANIVRQQVSVLTECPKRSRFSSAMAPTALEQCHSTRCWMRSRCSCLAASDASQLPRTQHPSLPAMPDCDSVQLYSVQHPTN